MQSVAAKSAGVAYVGAAVAGALALGAAVVVAPALAALVLAAALAVALIVAVPTEVAVAAMLWMVAIEAALPADAGRAAFVVRYGPEVIAVVVAIRAIVQSGAPRATRVLASVATAFVAVGLISTMVNATPFSTAIVGLRAELRFVPIAIALAAVPSPTSALRLTARTVFAIATFEAFVGALQAIGLPAARDLVARPATAIGGVVVTPAHELRAGEMAGTFTHYNHLAFALVCGWAAYRCCRHWLPASVVIDVLGWSLPVLTLATGSRQGVLALVIVTLISGGRQLRFAAVAAAAAALLFAPLLIDSGDRTDSSSHSLGNRWSVFLDPTAYNPGTSVESNFRLSLLTTEIDALRHGNLAFGRGPGSITDRRTIEHGTNPLLESVVGRRAIEFDYQYDGQVGLLLVEFGLLGTALFATLVLAGIRGARVIKETGPRRLVLATTSAVVFVALFGTSFQVRYSSLVFWSMVGLAIAFAHQRSLEESSLHQRGGAASS